jgi:hypothetical protein
MFVELGLPELKQGEGKGGKKGFTPLQLKHVKTIAETCVS